ncbi:hypothetical protein L195_g000271 [Trifolium pratense]|uniref:Uncharacterized protein n=1 Tax=Trifolium pratense TaxID=57577 RepID=A0A2K3NLE7_TRIPR|nr:hypothetical protein L195_g000271 [Trifolium pratense]
MADELISGQWSCCVGKANDYSIEDASCDEDLTGELSKFKDALDEDYIIAVGEDASSSDGAPFDDLKVPLIVDDDEGGDCI